MLIESFDASLLIGADARYEHVSVLLSISVQRLERIAKVGEAHSEETENVTVNKSNAMAATRRVDSHQRGAVVELGDNDAVERFQKVVRRELFHVVLQPLYLHVRVEFAQLVHTRKPSLNVSLL